MPASRDDQHPAALAAHAQPVDVLARPGVVNDQQHLAVLEQAVQMGLVVAGLAGAEVVVAERHDPLAEQQARLGVLAEGGPDNAVL